MSDQKTKPTNSDRLRDLLGFDAAKKGVVTQDVFTEALAEINKERKEAAKVKAKEQLQLAMGLREQAARAEREFKQQVAKFEKELGKIINSLVASLNGTPAEEQQPEETQEGKEEAAS